MNIPKYVEDLIVRRQKLAEQLAVVSAQLDEWLVNKGIPVGGDYTNTGCMIYCEPEAAADCVRRDIINKE